MDEFTLDLVPEGNRNQYHTPGEGFRSILVRTPNQSSPLSMRGRVVEVHHGKMIYEEEQSAATLVVFEFRFQSEFEDRRYKTAKIVVEFLDQGGDGDFDPVVVELAPDHTRYLNKATVAHSVSRGFNLTGKAGPGGVAGVDAGVQWTVQESGTKEYSARLIGLPGVSEGKTSDKDNTVAWSMEENKHKADGVPSFLQTAVLLKHTNRPFYGKLRVYSSVDWLSAARRVLDVFVASDRDKIIDPVTFDPTAATPQLKSNKATGITKDQLGSMQKLPVGSYFRVQVDHAEEGNEPKGTGGAGAGQEEANDGSAAQSEPPPASLALAINIDAS